MALTNDELTFVQGVAAQTGIDPRVLIAWIQSEGPPGNAYHNYMNIKTSTAASIGVPTVGTAAAGTAEFGDVQTGIAAAVKEIQSLGLTHLANETPQQEITQIAASPWASSHYGGPGGPNLQTTFASLFTQAGLTSAYEGSGQLGSIAEAGSGSANLPGGALGGLLPPNVGANPAGGVISGAETAAGDVASAVTSWPTFIKFVTSWRFAEIIGGILLLLVGLVLLGRQFGLAAPQTPASKLADSATETFALAPGQAAYSERQPTSRPRQTRTERVTLPADQPAPRRASTAEYGDVPY